ncbi:hypothetical protein C8J56DRAFT_918997 [Mycena floridula]|nr:hypothetical protein C8J56DRAFT_918997 [Mycena floridula]
MSSSLPGLQPVLDESSAAEARAQLIEKEKRRFHTFFKKKQKPFPQQDPAPQETQPMVHATDDIPTSISILEPPDVEGMQDQYQWITVYENQRGMTLFSMPFYSHLSLLPSDPAAFTVPSAFHAGTRQPNVSLQDFPLPDGHWRWLSKAWMVDMRSDSGEVQHDGFEYNWVFRSKNWRPHVGPLSAGGWVRRRRWIRLAWRPGPRRQLEDGTHTPTPPEQDLEHYRHSIAESFHSSTNFDAVDQKEVWLGNLEEDWDRCQSVLKSVGTDGQKLEVWRRWLNLEKIIKGPRKQQWTEDDYQPVALESLNDTNLVQSRGQVRFAEHIAAVVDKYGNEILGQFRYPESRASFIELMGTGNILRGDGSLEFSSRLDFHSYTSGLDDLCKK